MDCDHDFKPGDKFMSKCENVQTAMCELVYNPNPQLDCTSNWAGPMGCGQEEADILCKVLIKNPKAKAKEFKTGTYLATRGLLAQEILNKEAVELISIPDEIYPNVYYYESNPYLVPTMTLEVQDNACTVE